LDDSDDSILSDEREVEPVLRLKRNSINFADKTQEFSSLNLASIITSLRDIKATQSNPREE
jgi:hypothetical protein